MGAIHQFLSYFHSDGIRALIEGYGLPVICAIVFAESGAFPMLPGDSLLVVCGIYAATPSAGGHVLSLAALLTLVPLCGVLGSQVGYQVGRWAGPLAWKWKDRHWGPVPLYRHAWLAQTEAFFRRWGTFAVVASRWVPFVRTGAPLLAGASGIPYRRYIPNNIVGAFAWVWSVVLLGYFLPPLLARTLPGYRLEDHIETIIGAVVALSLLPIVYTLWKERGAAARPVAGPKKKAPRRAAPARRPAR